MSLNLRNYYYDFLLSDIKVVQVLWNHCSKARQQNLSWPHLVEVKHHLRVLQTLLPNTHHDGSCAKQELN